MDEAGWRALIEDRLAQAESQRRALRVAIEEMRDARRLTFTDDEHDPEGSTVSLDQARDSALLDRVEASIVELDAARRATRDRHVRSVRAMWAAHPGGASGGPAGGPHLHGLRRRFAALTAATVGQRGQRCSASGSGGNG